MGRTIQIQAECQWCGTVAVGPADLRCAVEPGGQASGLCEFACPYCSRLLVVATTATKAETLLREGARIADGLVPFEVLEAHVGSPVTWDDYLDLRLALEGTDTPQAELIA